MTARLESDPAGRLIAVVDDDDAFRDSMGRLLRSMGYPTATFASAMAFLQSPQLVETSCLIADIQMPRMTGIELHRSLVELGRRIPTILVTAYASQRDAGELLETGVDCYLRKPVNEADLIDCLRCVMTREPIVR